MNQFSIQTSDNQSIEAIRFVPENPNGQVVVINPAMAVPQRYYGDFANYLAENGFFVYTYDYRGIGLSRKGSLKGLDTTMTTWATLDYPAVIDFVKKEHPNMSISLVGHSFGGNLLGQHPTSQQLHKIAMVGSQHGYFGLYWASKKPLLMFLWYVLMPITSSLYGYFPSKIIGMGEELPKKVALQWARVCRTPRWFFEYLKPEENFYTNITSKMLVISIEDDWYAPKKAVEKLISEGYNNAQTTRQHLVPTSVGVKEIGHFGYFRKKFKDILWQDILNFLK